MPPTSKTSAAAAKRAASPRRNSCSVSSTTCRGRISTSLAPPGRRRMRRPCPKAPPPSGCVSSSASLPSITSASSDRWAMTEVGFYHLRSTSLERALPRLLERALAEGHRVVVMAGSPERVQHLDDLLWTYSDESFLPHGAAKHGH